VRGLAGVQFAARRNPLIGQAFAISHGCPGQAACQQISSLMKK
jgi:hypothetical protein